MKLNKKQLKKIVLGKGRWEIILRKSGGEFNIIYGNYTPFYQEIHIDTDNLRAQIKDNKKKKLRTLRFSCVIPLSLKY